ncbi:hypothetical protein [Streptomyces sp. NPDC001480]|uniref:hypothetical protein n=1 Tax=Streptomyces sp. NPDC001480 TaxID=3364577 RepID=UPI0036BC036B
MNQHPDHDPQTQCVAQWLEQHTDALADALDAALDIEAGLREIPLHSRHDTAIDDLDTLLDTEAGLATILPTTPQRPPVNLDDAHGVANDHASAEEFLRSVSPAERMALRNHPEVKAVSQALARHRYYSLSREPNPLRTLGTLLELARDLVHALDADLHRAGELGRARDLTDDLTRSLNRAHVRPSDARDLARNLADLLGTTHDRDLDLDRARDRAQDLTRVLDRAHDLSRKLTRGHDRAHAQSNPRAYARVIVAVRTNEVCRAIGSAMRQKTPTLDKASVRTFLNDFTTADLRTADLAGIDLGGVRWSQYTTQWPVTLEVENLKARSKETPPGRGTWTVQPDPATIRDFADRGCPPSPKGRANQLGPECTRPPAGTGHPGYSGQSLGLRQAPASGKIVWARVNTPAHWRAVACAQAAAPNRWPAGVRRGAAGSRECWDESPWPSVRLQRHSSNNMR